MKAINDAQQNHIEQSLNREQRLMKSYRPSAIKYLNQLMNHMDHDTGDEWSRWTLELWSLTTGIVSIAVCGRDDGYFNTPYPPLNELVKALFE